MNIMQVNTESKWYVSLWVVAVIVGWFVWFHILDDIVGIWSWTLPLAFGLVTGTLSGLSPKRAFQAIFFGFCVIALLFLIPIPLVVPLLIFFGVLTGLIAMAAAVVRRVLLHQNPEIGFRFWQ
jgi:hypothetical protein